MIYVHVPFCRSFCTYCGFYSEICSRKDPQQVQKRVVDDYVEALCGEIAARREEVDAARGAGLAGARGAMPAPAPSALCEAPAPIAPSSPSSPSSSFAPSASPAFPVPPAPDTLYIGGGTPSVLPLSALERIVGAIGRADYEEFTIEVNPDDIVSGGRDYVEGLMRLGVNRISMGVQSFDDGILRWMNRRHDAAGAREAFRLLRACGVANISIDLIFGLSQLSDSLWTSTVAEAIALRPEHVSAYQLSIEEGSALERMVADGRYEEAADEQCRRQYDILCGLLSGAGYVHYEISNWALPGREAVHNSAYWCRVPYVGLGPGAHSFSLPASPAVSGSPSVPTSPSAPSASTPSASASFASAAPIAASSASAAASVAFVPAASFADAASSASATASAHTLPDDAVPSSFGTRSWNSAELPWRGADGLLHRWRSGQETLSEREAAEETIMLALRTSRGLPLGLLRAISPAAPVDVLLSEGALMLIPSPIPVPAPIPSITPSIASASTPASAFTPSFASATTTSSVTDHHPIPANSWIRIPEDHFFVSDDIIARLLP